ncbi:MAG TPA: hypothetical protein VN843_03465 [Anaerolineales bacterium]|nr:hypothetical protein [Anaerolineales bacterium]
MVLIYLSLISIGSFIFMIRMRYIEIGLGEAKAFADNVGNAKNLIEYIVLGFELTIDVLKDTLKYILIALVISLISIFIYIWGLQKPERWKSYSLLIVGIACAWITLAPSGEIAKTFEGAGMILQITLAVIGHVYIVTSIWQFIYSTQHTYFLEDIQARDNRLLDKKLNDMVDQKAHEDPQFRRFFNQLSGSGKDLFQQKFRLYSYLWRGLLSASGEEISNAQLEQCLDAIWHSWPKNSLPDEDLDRRIEMALPEFQAKLKAALDANAKL